MEKNKGSSTVKGQDHSLMSNCCDAEAGEVSPNDAPSQMQAFFFGS